MASEFEKLAHKYNQHMLALMAHSEKFNIYKEGLDRGLVDYTYKEIVNQWNQCCRLTRQAISRCGRPLPIHEHNWHVLRGNLELVGQQLGIDMFIDD